MNDLVDVLESRTGTSCAVGAGGKKTTLYHLATTHPGRVGLTSTVPTARFPSRLGAYEVIAEGGELVDAVLQAARRHPLVAFARPEVKRARYGGLSSQLLEEIQEARVFDLLLVKGDGARRRWIKAPTADEPVIPIGTTTVLPVVSARAMGEPLTEQIAHRLHRVEKVTGARYGETVRPAHIARLLADPDGSLKGTGEMRVIPILNMVDNKELETAALEAAEAALEMTDRYDRIVLTCHLSPDRLVAVVSR
ncbi:MAG: putative selenium-dependent hydroxylase accessory protein YqeC [Gemmatimonadetes bacterium]|uniref:Selenium-dependent hydroxylase accessory protein YqeC n=1 Tax=Candidatus Kutchimonas denitrificans TaxID=3056748 RepID=A0AAE4Z676_9BACT|nr:putative selenium-dependent hydroxylase accessory protein YqeC [Gemmatimonadota bacterium]NIR74499.1 putative selenium-dependent hydroxylase accessory protein YqeC [Candidatus Kutchimonas denitrificans]NIS02689.1 putative selenium-dependent hydroxylase accessory protein YqeC [Gemmatimonadota bacterium]NIT68850.1 putative selenium-dependent hydroxylase accessory protein YqeC [Gemmatimonadota bacterium]NIU52155.1 putative selenium-dependent hydroxylase accessory protein YqeC [Gemmatimonadota b